MKESQAVIAKQHQRKNSASLVHESVAEEDEEVSPEEASFDEQRASDSDFQTPTVTSPL